jgi:hypothetical protein
MKKENISKALKSTINIFTKIFGNLKLRKEKILSISSMQWLFGHKYFQPSKVQLKLINAQNLILAKRGTYSAAKTGF